MSLLSGFGVVALVLAAIGIYGVLSCTVAQRTSEIGVRMALGARRSDVGGMVLREALLLTLLAISAGCGLSLVLTRSLRGLLFEVSPGDPATLRHRRCRHSRRHGILGFSPRVACSQHRADFGVAPGMKR